MRKNRGGERKTFPVFLDFSINFKHSVASRNASTSNPAAVVLGLSFLGFRGFSFSGSGGGGVGAFPVGGIGGIGDFPEGTDGGENEGKLKGESA